MLIDDIFAGGRWRAPKIDVIFWQLTTNGIRLSAGHLLILFFVFLFSATTYCIYTRNQCIIDYFLVAIVS